MAAGKVHFAVVTMENELYTWATAQGGAEMVGQLGHGNTAMYKAPKCVESFEGVHINQVGGGILVYITGYYFYTLVMYWFGPI